MSANEELHIINENLSTKRESIIQRIMNLSDEQFELLLTLYSQQQQESCPACPTQIQTSA